MVDRGNSRQSFDKYLWWPSLFAFIPPLIFTLILAIPDSSFFAILLVAPFLLLIMAIAAVWASLIGIISLRQKAWRKALSAVVLSGVLALYILTFDGSGTQTHRYLYEPGTDQILADENASGTVLWTLTDNQGTVRDLVDSTGTVQNHIRYDSLVVLHSNDKLEVAGF